MSLKGPYVSQKRALHIHKRALCIHKRALCILKRALHIHKRALYMFKRALCIHNRALYIHNRAQPIHKKTLNIKRALHIHTRALNIHKRALAKEHRVSRQLMHLRHEAKGPNKSTRVLWGGFGQQDRLNYRSLLQKICKKALSKRRFSAEETCNLIDPTDHSHPVPIRQKAMHIHKRALHV